MSTYTPLTDAEVTAVMDDSQALARLCNRQRMALYSIPAQSHFRVFAFMVVTCDGHEGYKVVEGANMEPGYIGGAICAERAALSRLRFLPNPILVKVVVTTDSNDPISPGMLCREYMMSAASPTCSIVITNAASDNVTTVPLGSLFPFPYVYRYEPRGTVGEFASSFSRRTSTEGWSSRQLQLYQQAKLAVNGDEKDGLHPVRLGAAILLENGEIERAWILKGLEYGCTMCPVSQLLREMEKRRLPQFCFPCQIESSNIKAPEGVPVPASAVAVTATAGGAASGTASSVVWPTAADCGDATSHPRPECLVMLDQWGVAHAPFASARAILSEYGYGDLQILVHDEEGAARVCTAGSLCPPPKDGKFMTHDLFL